MDIKSYVELIIDNGKLIVMMIRVLLIFWNQHFSTDFMHYSNMMECEVY